MIKLAITGGAVIYSISQVQEIPSKNGGAPFQKRELIIDDSWTDREGVLHPNFVLIEFTGDKMQQLDNFQPGQRVNVDACINGREYNGRVFTTIKGLGITPYQQPQQTYPQQPQQSYGAPAQPSAYPQQTAYPQQPGYPQQAAYPTPPSYQQPAYPQQPAQHAAPFPGQYPAGGNAPQNLGVSGLPFDTNHA